MLAFHGAEALLALAYFGSRGNLIFLQRVPLDPVQVAKALLQSHWTWRIALAPATVVQALVDCGGLLPTVQRRQCYYGMLPSDVQPSLVDESLRQAECKDVRPLMAAALDLNASDLNVEAWRINKDWLKRHVKERCSDGTTLVLGPVGKPQAKLDLGSWGPYGTVLEGVYTWPDFRGQGLAGCLVASVVAKAVDPASLFCLHVAESNAAARRAYEKVGMQEMGDCTLMLRG